jgi:hypothetical protein
MKTQQNVHRKCEAFAATEEKEEEIGVTLRVL